jgi:hypothetical protein
MEQLLTAEEKRRWVQALKDNPFRYARGSYQEDDRVCAIGMLWLVNGIDTPDMPFEHQNEIMHLSDTKGWAAVIEYIETKLPDRPTPPG